MVHERPRPWHCLVQATIILSMMAACKETATPTRPPRPTPLPTATPSPERVLEGSLFTITFGGTLLATEEIHVGRADDQLVAFSEMHRFVDYPTTVRRTVVLSGVLNPVRYDLEMRAFGVHSTWIGSRTGDVMDCLSNNLAWYGPLLVDGVAPAPQVMLESSPSALPFALLALRYRGGQDEVESRGSMQLHSVDVMEDYPVSRLVEVTVAPERTGAVIGTLALEGRIERGRNPHFTMWIRPGRRTLYRVEMDDYRFGLWEELAHPAFRVPGKLVIQRVSELPELPAPRPDGEAKRVSLEFLTADKTRRSGTLILPAGEGPFPCVVLHSSRGAVPRWDTGDAFARRGWAVYGYDKRGLGESEGQYDRGTISALAEDSVAAAEMLRQRPELDGERIVFLGVGEGGQVGALAIGLSDVYAAAVLASCASNRSTFPELAEHRIRAVLAPFYGWDDERTGEYEDLSVLRWQEWLFEGKEEVSFLRRRASLRALKEKADLDLSAALARSQAPVLLLHGQGDVWTPVEHAYALQEGLAAAGIQHVGLEVFEGLGADLGGDEAEGVFAPDVEESLFAWLQETLLPQ